MAMKEYVGAVVLEVDGKEIECVRESPDMIPVTHPYFEGIRKPFRETRLRAGHSDSHSSILA